jgi:hypothetical protein
MVRPNRDGRWWAIRYSQAGGESGPEWVSLTIADQRVEEYIREESVASPVSAPGQYVQVPGPVEYRREYTLWILILLIIICWPVAIIYYFTRDKVPVQKLTTYSAPVQPAWSGAPPAAAGGTRFCPSCGAAGQKSGGFCASCGKPVPP